MIDDAIKKMEAIIFYLIIFVVLLSAIVKYYQNSEKKKEAFNKLSGYLSGSILNFSFVPTFKSVYQGLNFFILLFPVSRSYIGGCGHLSRLEIQIRKKSVLQFRIFKEEVWKIPHAAKELLGFFHEAEMDDEIFDKQLLIYSNNLAPVIDYLNKDSIKNTIKNLFNSGFAMLAIESDKASIKKINYNLTYDLEPQKIVEALQQLSLIIAGT